MSDELSAHAMADAGEDSRFLLELKRIPDRKDQRDVALSCGSEVSARRSIVFHGRVINAQMGEFAALDESRAEEKA